MSYSICKADFYYGAFLSVITNNGIRPVIVEVGNKEIFMIYRQTKMIIEYIQNM